MEKKDIKIFAFVGNIVAETVVTIALGILLGMGIDHISGKDFFVVICSVLFTFTAIVNIFVSLWKLCK